MRRTDRLFRIIQVLRRKRRPITGRELADELEISLRTLYRDMAELSAQRVPIRGEAGTGYVLDPSYDMPPLMLTPDELEAAVLGAAWVALRGDPALERAAQDLVAKLTQVVPKALRPVLLDATLKPVSFRSRAADSIDVSALRRAIRDRCRVTIAYRDGEGATSERTIWPFLLAYMEETRIVAAWCELRRGFRHFRTDRIDRLTPLADHYPERREELRRRWELEINTHRATRESATTSSRGDAG